MRVFVDEYSIPDGIGVRFYPCCNLAPGHIAALSKLEAEPVLTIYDLGTGAGYVGLEIEDVTGFSIPYEVAYRRSGDIVACWADPQKL